MTKPPRLEKQHFFEEEFVDVIINMVTDLTTELGVVKERLDTVERVLDKHGVASRELIEEYEPSKVAALERAQARMKLVQTVLDPLRHHFSAAGKTEQAE